jgi:ABC-2 type transport system permease protein
MTQASTRLEGLTYPRELLVNLTLRELRSKYKRSTLGWAWSVINPAVTIIVYTVVFGVIIGLDGPVGDPSGLDSYAFYLMTGLIPWLFLSNGINESVGSLTGNEGLIKKVYFDRSVLPTSATLATLASFAIEMAVLGVLLVTIAGNMILPWVPVVLAVMAIELVFVLGLGLLFAPLNAYFRDVSHFVTIVLNVWFWATPILWTESLLYNDDGAPKQILGIDVTTLIDLNPMSHFVTAYRDLLYSLRFPAFTTWAAMAVAAAVSLGVGMVVFRRFEPHLAEEL